jgi:hypothetical protein
MIRAKTNAVLIYVLGGGVGKRMAQGNVHGVQTLSRYRRDMMRKGKNDEYDSYGEDG